MVHDGVVVARHAHAVAGGGVGRRAVPGVAAAEEESHEARDAVALHAEGLAAQEDAAAGGRLSGNGDELVGDDQAVVERDDAGHIEHDGAWSANILNAVAERSRSGGVVERGDMIDRSPASANGEAPVALGSGEGEAPRLEGHYAVFVHGAVGLHLVNAPPVAFQWRESTGGVNWLAALVLEGGGGGHGQRVGAQCQTVADGDGGRRPAEGDVAVFGLGVQVVVLGLGVQDAEGRLVKFQGVERDAGGFIGGTGKWGGGVGDDHGHTLGDIEFHE